MIDVELPLLSKFQVSKPPLRYECTRNVHCVLLILILLVNAMKHLELITHAKLHIH